MKVIYILLATLFIVSCSRKNSNLVEDIDNQKVQLENIEFDTTSLILTCQGSKELLDKNSKVHQINKGIIKCLLSNGFNGDYEANSQLAKFILFLGQDKVTQLFFTGEQFRGEKVFDALFSIGENYNPAINFNGESLLYRTKTDAFAYRYLDMIESIDGKSPSEYLNQIHRLHNFKNTQLDSSNMSINFKFTIEQSTLVYQSIKEARWNGKIVFKVFGLE